ncbi:alkaline phosphatase D [Saccharopolyspora antimicrobica]|uniref:Alkaline phosphatase D n=1 Tax=Saccharopolyspora antimicrobica TaxID=455193 RepID=A0A1I4U6H2_9PSEU|nr:alkaline phosphatase D family protein [Saccharopolyspora antimicrobica]RKT88707.1 alkaline phosphatase D [Saccharopolyspora antimicrobica]SFM84588.1 alkaline phosphatase D [Saccharopolyspora antimicrobica]
MTENSGTSGANPSRRQVLLAGTAALGAAALTTAGLGSTAASALPGAGGQIRSPFTLGVASGDPLPHGVVLWTRLAMEPLADNGLGGMPDRVVPVQWQVAEDEGFRKIVAQGTAQARPESAHSVHVELFNLNPATEYYYRFRAGNELSPVGRTRTAPRFGAQLDKFSFAFASCQNYPVGHFSAYSHMVQEDLDLVAFLGDYIYEGGAKGSIGRPHAPARETFDLADYRTRHAQYKTDPDLQAAHAAFPWVVVFDDHEVENNWAADRSQPDDEPDQDPAVFRKRRTEAFQAYYENMPLRETQHAWGANMRLYRRLTFGNLVDFHLLDTRQYRDFQDQDKRLDAERTILGAEQRNWLLRNLGGQTARWNVLAQQVFFSQRDFTAGDEDSFSDDAWDNYVAERNLVRDRMAKASNPVVITGDVHANYVCDVKADFDDPASATVATELVGTSITSNGNGVEQNPGDAVQLAENPHIKFINRHRGYVRNTITPSAWTADFRVLDYVEKPGSPIRDRARFVIDDGRPGANLV